MPDNTLQFQTRVDLSGLNSGVAAASAAVSKFGSDTKASMSAAAIATNQLADAQKQLGAAAAQGNAQAQAIIAEYQAAVEAATPAVRNLAAVEEVEGGAVRHAMSDRMVANVALREMSMNFGNANRAAAAFLTTIPGIGAALQIAFPVFGAIALIEVFGQMAEKVHKIYDEFVHLTAEEAVYHRQLLADGEDEIRSSERLLATLRERDVLNAELNGPKAGRANRGQAAGAAFDITQNKGAIESDRADIDRLTARMKELDKARQPLDNWLLSSPAEYLMHSNAMKQAGIEYDTLRGQVTALYKDEQTRSVQLTTQQSSEQLRVKEAGEKEDTAGDSAARKAAAERYKAMQAEYDAEVISGNTTLAYEHKFWADRINLFEVGSDQYDAIFKKIAATAAEGAKKVHEALELLKAGDTVKANDLLTGAKTPKVDEGATDALMGQAAAQRMVAVTAQEASEQVAKLALESEHEKAAGAIQLKTTQVQSSSQLGLTDPGKDLAQLRSLHEQAIAEDNDYIQREMALLTQQAAQETALHQTEGDKVRSIQEKLDNELLALQKKLDENIKKGNQQQLQDTDKILQQELQKYKTTYQTITNDFNSTVAKLITSTESPGRAFARMLDSMIEQLAVFVLQYGEKKAEMWILDEIATRAHSAATLAALTAEGDAVLAMQTTQTTAGVAAQKAAAVGEITTDAAVAGAGAYAATAAIPLVGPELAPGAAAASYAGALSFLGLAAFEKGGIVGGMSGMPVPIMAHAGERVLTTQQTQNFERVANSTSNHRAVNIHYNPSINAYDRSGMKQTLTAERDTILSIVRQGLNSGALRR